MEKQQADCINKRTFETKEEASKSGGKFRLRTYKCLVGDHYHLTSQKAAKKRLVKYFKRVEKVENDTYGTRRTYRRIHRRKRRKST